MFPNDDGIFESCVVKSVPDLAGSGPNPNYQGLIIRDKDDLFPKAFSVLELNNVYASLCGNNHDEGLICECPSLEEVEYYNPGTEEVPDSFILEAITVDKFSRTEKRMAAVVRTFNKHLADSEIKALAPVVGKPKKSGTFAYVAVQLPFSDGQTVNVIFHSPEGDKKQIGANDSIIAFRWLLNKRDITQVVAPEDGAEVSLETIAKRITQLVVKNSARFEKQQKAAQAERQELDKAREDVKAAEDKQRELMDNVASATKETEGIEAQLANTLSLLEKQKVINAELQAQIDALKKAPPKTGGSGTTGTTGTGTTGTGGANGNGEKPAKVIKQMKYTDDSGREITYSITNVTPNGSATRNEYRISRSISRPDTGTISVNLFEDGEWAPWNSDTWKNPLRWTPDMSEAERFVEFDAKQHGYTKANADNSGTSNPESGTNPAAGGSSGNNGGATGEPPAFVTDLQDIVAGKYDADTDKIDQLIDQAQTQAESAGQFEANEDLFNEAADHLTELLKAKAGNI